MNIEQEVQKLDIQITNMVSTLDNIKEMVLKKDEVVDIDYKQLEKLAIQSKFQKHIVESFNDEIAYKYCLALASATQLVNDKSKQEKQMYFVYRIFHTKNTNLIAENIMRDIMVFSMSDFEMLINELWADEVFNLLVDMLLMISLDGEINEEQVNYLCEIFAYTGYDKNKITLVSRLVKSILMCDEKQIYSLAKEVNVNKYLTYIGVDLDVYVIEKFSDIPKNKKKIRIIGDTIKQKNIIINLDKLGKDEITFVGCKFEKINGIKALKTKINIIDCEFVGCHSLEKSSCFLEMDNANIKNTKFTKCVAETKTNFKFSNSRIENCEFESCKVICNEALNFSGCRLLCVTNTVVKQCKFTNCRASGVSKSRFWICLISAYNSEIIENEFLNCNCTTLVGSKKNYIIGYSEGSQQSNNKFEKCRSTQVTKNSNQTNNKCGVIY